jgi:hypothetical protein
VGSKLEVNRITVDCAPESHVSIVCGLPPFLGEKGADVVTARRRDGGGALLVAISHPVLLIAKPDFCRNLRGVKIKSSGTLAE